MSKVTFGTGPFNEGQVYLGSNGVNYVYESGCFNLSKPADIDTVDGYSEQGVSDGSQLDAEGNPIPAGNKITTFYDATGAVVNSRDDEKTQGSTTMPSADGLGQVITTSDNQTTYVASAQLTGPVLNPTTGMLEMLDQDGNVSGAPWFPVSPENQTKISLSPADGQVLDGNGVAVAATSISGEPILAGDRVIVECDPDTGAVIQVMTNALPKDCVLTINGQAPNADGNFEIEGDTIADNGDNTYTVTPGDGSPAYDIDARCKKYINLAIEPCPIVFPICGSAASGDLTFTSAQDIEDWLDQEYSGDLTFDSSTCVISGCILADVAFDLEIVPAASDVEMSSQGGDLGFNFISTSDGTGFTVTWPDGSAVSFASDEAFSVTGQPVGSAVIKLDNPCAKITRINTRLGSWDYSIEQLFSSVPSLQYYNNEGQNTTSGDLAVAFASVPGLTLYQNRGQNTTSGDLVAAFANLPSLNYYANTGQNTTSGDLVAAFASVPNLSVYQNAGFNTTSGDLVAAFANASGLKVFNSAGLNTTSGDLVAAFANASGLTFYENRGQNTTSGDLVAAFANASGLTYYANSGQNTTSGDLAAAFVNTPGLKTYQNEGQNTTSGDLVAAFANAPNLTFYENWGQNATSGDLASAFASVPELTFYANAGSNTTSVSGVMPLSSTFRYFLQQGSGNSATEIDLILQSLANVTTWIFEKDVYIAANNSAPSAAGSAFIPVILITGNGGNDRADQVVTN